MSEWESVPQAQNIVRHAKSGTYYLRAKVGGKIIRRSLQTKSLKAARQLRDKKLPLLRQAAEAQKLGRITNLTQAVQHATHIHSKKPGIKQRTRDYWEELGQSLLNTLPLSTPPHQLSTNQLREWWRSYNNRYSAQRANNALIIVQTLCQNLVETGAQNTDISSSLQRVPVPVIDRQVLSRQQLTEVISDILSQKKRASTECANMVAFLAFSGLRISELNRLTWENIHEEHLEIITSKSRGDKSVQRRRVPIIAPLREVIDRIRETNSSGSIFHLKSPVRALTNSCERLKFPHQKVHDLRHFFATMCIEQGVEIPTVAKWLGHKDKGVLAMKTYGHLRDEHSIAQAKKII